MPQDTPQERTLAVLVGPRDLTLNGAQIEQVIREAGGEPVSALLSKLSADSLRQALQSLEVRGLSQSMLLGLLIYTVLPTDGSDLGINQLGRALTINLSTVHRYISTLLAIGLVKRDPRSRRYRKA